MAEVAGLILGGIPILIWTIEKYSTPKKAYFGYERSVNSLKAALTLQIRALEKSLNQLGLDIKTAKEDELRQCLREHFPNIAEEVMTVIHQMEGITTELLDSLKVDASHKPSDVTERTKWEFKRIRHSLKAGTFEKYISELRTLNDDLKRALERPDLPPEDENEKVQILTRRFRDDRCNKMRLCLRSFHEALQSHFKCTCSGATPHQAALNLDWESGETDLGKRFAVAIRHRSTDNVSALHSWRRYRIASEDGAGLVPAPTGSPMSLAPKPPPSRPQTDKKPSRVSWATNILSGPRSGTVSPIPSSTVRAVPPPRPVSPGVEIVNLCEAISSTSGACLPYLRRCSANDVRLHLPPGERQFVFLHDQERTCYISGALPLTNLFPIPPERRSKASAPPFPNLSAKQRYGIAASVAWSVLHLSDGPWLGQTWHREQMSLLLETYESGREIPARHPSILQTFGKSEEQEDSGENTPNKARRIARTSDHIENPTIFALGVLLIELCLNESLQQSSDASAPEAQTTTSPTEVEDHFAVGFDDIDYAAAKARLDDVFNTAGNSYGGAAERCIYQSFGIGSADKRFDLKTFRTLFYGNVVAPVQATYQQMPGSVMAL